MEYSVYQVPLQYKQSSPLPRYLVGISTKMYFSHAQTMQYIKALASVFPFPMPDLRIFFIPSFPSILPSAAFLQEQLKTITSSQTQPSILLGAQDCSSASSGPHTGSVSAAQILEIGASLVELGHAERRKDPINESNDFVAAKAHAAVEAGLVPLVCIGERERGRGVMSEAVGRAVAEVSVQVETILDAVSSGLPTGSRLQDQGPVSLIFAYEPVWAIGAKEPAAPDHVNAVVREVRRLIDQFAARKGMEGKLDIRILYGGSAGPGTWAALKSDLDGLFLGRFAHDIENVKLVVNEILSWN